MRRRVAGSGFRFRGSGFRVEGPGRCKALFPEKFAGV